MITMFLWTRIQFEGLLDAKLIVKKGSSKSNLYDELVLETNYYKKHAYYYIIV